jgi:metal-responsive CopG/Arc/MetJ family transcriptional regulator
VAKGKTISITLPQKIVDFYEGRAKEIGMSRSALICDIIMTDYDRKLKQENLINVSTSCPQTENS